jgi:2-hydroxy-3-keto-5-methylthiopentenyl-1-phosphate phosphatase
MLNQAIRWDRGRGVLVTDFDGTMTRRDFYQIVYEQLVRDDTPSYWDEYVAGRMTHFEALAGYFRAMDTTEARLHKVMDDMGFDDQAGRAIEELRECGWDVVVASAGCAWYIEQILARAGIDVALHANPGKFTDSSISMELPVGAAYFSPQNGIDKAAIVRDALAHARVVAFAGDGLPDFPAAMLVRPELRFARGMLAEKLAGLGEPFIPFERWSEVPARIRENRSERNGVGEP